MATNRMLSLLAHLQQLKHLPRTGWLFAGIAHPESVAEHSFVTTWLALLLAEQINQDPAAHGLTQPMEIAKVIQIALVHDVAESILTDLPKRSTALLGKAVKQQAEAEAMEQLFGDIAPGQQHLADWQAYATQSSPEGRLVRDADKLEMVHQALYYEQMGQQNLAEFWHEHTWNYTVSRNLFQALERMRASTPPALDEPQ